ncbi:MAG: DUF3179 domain-containing protein [Flavobacteriaceae bacterium]|nr:DUF3179 domain-containing protein [Flavobacteriaceae bacterium]
MFKNKRILTFIILFVSFSTIAQAQFKNPKKLPFTWKTDIKKHTVKLSEIMIVLPKGSFPKIEHPKYVGRQEATTMFYGKEPVITVSINGQAKAFSLNMLTTHEMVNDELGSVPILATYCPLCNAGLVYNRKVTINGKTEILDFEVSGMLRNSDMVMMDTKTETLWQQLTGEAIVGTYSGNVLTAIPSMIVSVDEFFTRYPMGQILSKKTGIAQAEKYYGYNPYVNYDSKAKPISQFINPLNVSSRLPAMARVVDIQSEGKYKIYPFSTIAKKGVIHDDFKSAKIVVFFKSGTISVMDKADITKSKDIGTVTVFKRFLNGQEYRFKKIDNTFVDDNTHSKWDVMGYCYEGVSKGKQLEIEPHGNHFAFAWFAFHPKTKIFKNK